MSFLTTVYVATAGINGKGKVGTVVSPADKTAEVYETELSNIAKKCTKAMEFLRSKYGKSAAWSEVDKKDAAMMEFKFWTLADGKPGQKPVDAEYITRLQISLYTCMEYSQSDPEAELELHRTIRSAVRNFRLYTRYVAIMKANDAKTRAERSIIEKEADAAEYGIVLADKAEEVKQAEEWVERVKADIAA